MADDTVASLLQRSVQEHMRALSLRRNRAPVAARQALISARDLRVQAINLDPEMKDPAWAAERVRNDEMLSFYAQQLDP